MATTQYTILDTDEKIINFFRILPQGEKGWVIAKNSSTEIDITCYLRDLKSLQNGMPFFIPQSPKALHFGSKAKAQHFIKCFLNLRGCKAITAA